MLASTVLLVLVTNVGWGAPEHRALVRADLALSSVLLAEWLARFWPNISLRFSHEEKVRALAPSLPWLVVDGVASLAHSLTAALALSGVGSKLALDVVACLRILRLITLVRNTSTAELVVDVLWESSHALKGPMYFLAVSTVFFGVAASQHQNRNAFLPRPRLRPSSSSMNLTHSSQASASHP